jgi:microcompartment protein CcmK/EutM
MRLGLVIGSVVSTVKNEALRGKKLLVVQPLGANLRAAGTSFLAVDGAGAGVGETVVVADEGTCAAMVLREGKFLPVRSVVLGIVDRVDTIG